MATSKPVHVLNDRIPVSLLAKKYPEIHKHFLSQNRGKLNTKERAHFVGMTISGSGETVAFLPREFSHADEVQSARLALTVLAKYGLEQPKREKTAVAGSDTTDILALVKFLANDFVEYGLYQERLRVRSRNVGKPDWKNTVTKELPSTLSPNLHHCQISFCSMIGSRRSVQPVWG